MSKPPRDRSDGVSNTYFVTANTFGGQMLFQSERVARLLIDTLLEYRGQKKFGLHEFVVMPNHFHGLFTTGDNTTLERAMQLIKGGFSYRVRAQLGINGEVWQRGYVDHRVRDARDFAYHRSYIHQNPVRAHLAESTEKYPYSSAHSGFVLDEAPQRLKPLIR